MTKESMIRRFMIALGLIQVEQVTIIKRLKKYSKHKKHNPHKVTALCDIDRCEFGMVPYGVTEDLPPRDDLQVSHYCKHEDTDNYGTWGGKCCFQYHLNNAERKELGLPL